MWLTIKEYAKQEKLTLQGVYYRINNETIPPARVRKNDGGKIEIKVENENEVKEWDVSHPFKNGDRVNIQGQIYEMEHGAFYPVKERED